MEVTLIQRNRLQTSGSHKKRTERQILGFLPWEPGESRQELKVAEDFGESVIERSRSTDVAQLAEYQQVLSLSHKELVDRLNMTRE
jgi:hypothetical protein